MDLAGTSWVAGRTSPNDPRGRREQGASTRVASLGDITWVVGEAALLDLDGTLVHSEPLHRQAFREYFTRRGWPIDEGTLARFMGRRGADVLASTDGPWRDEDPQSVTEAIIATFVDLALEPEPVPGAVDFLHTLTEAGIPIAIVTSATREWAEAAMRVLQVDLPVLITAEQCVNGKPDPTPYLLGAQALSIDASRTFAVEDSTAGVQSARAAGVGAVVGLSTSLPGAALIDAGADLSVRNLVRLRARPTHVTGEAIHGRDVPRCR